LDISVYETDKLRKYELDSFNIRAKIAEPYELETFRKTSTLNLSGLKAKILFRTGFTASEIIKVSKDTTIIKERVFSFDPSVPEKRGNLYIDGYWQSEKYFLPVRDIILDELNVRYEQDLINRKISGNIQNTESVSIHVRRGDYVINPSTNKYHGLCSPEYYTSAVNLIAQKIADCNLFLFSDDPEWARENFEIDYPVTIVDNNGDSKSYEDLRLMSLCKHHITANSSFSWWGAWLNRNPGKIVVAPGQWFADYHRNSRTKDLIPETWMRI
jgi:hypothetical protein